MPVTVVLVDGEVLGVIRGHVTIGRLSEITCRYGNDNIKLVRTTIYDSDFDLVTDPTLGD